MLKQIMALLFVLSAAGGSPGFADDAGRMPRTKGNHRERSDYSGGDARLGGGLSADPAGADAGNAFRI